MAKRPELLPRVASLFNGKPIHARGRLSVVDLVVFLAVSGFFGHSLLRLFGNWDQIKIQNPPMARAPSQGGLADSRVPASVTPVPSSFGNLEVPCDGLKPVETKATRIRLSGLLCGASEGDTLNVVRTEITNQTNQVAATVFTDSALNRYLTDYIPLANGDNTVQLKFVHRDGKTQTQEVRIKR